MQKTISLTENKVSFKTGVKLKFIKVIFVQLILKL